MPKEIVWSPDAAEDLMLLVSYLKKCRPDRVLIRFYVRLQTALDQILHNPGQFPYLSKRKGYRKCILTKQNTIFYKEFTQHILNLRPFDTRQDPKRRNLP